MATVMEFKKPAGSVPFDMDAESGLLGAILYDNTLMEEVGEILPLDAFYDGDYRAVYQTIQRLTAVGRAADLVTVNHAAKGYVSAPEGLFGLLKDLVEISVSRSSAVEYAKVIAEMAWRRNLVIIGEELAAQARAGVPAAEVQESAERSLGAASAGVATVSMVSPDAGVTQVLQQLDHPELAFGIKTGLSPIDEVTGGFMRGELWLLAGRPGSGKSAIASSASLRVGRHGMTPKGNRLGVIEICSEMTVAQMMRRHIADYAHELFGPDAPTYSAVRKRMLSKSQKSMFHEAAKQLRELDTIRCVYQTGLTVPSIRRMCRRQKAVWARNGTDLGMVVIDHAGLIKASSSRGGRSEQQGEVARETKELPGELDCAVLTLVQLSRKVEERDDHRPQLSDLRDSGEWEENADGVIGVYRDAYYAKRLASPRGDEAKRIWEERCISPWVDAMFLKIREGEMQTVKLWADMGRNAIRGGIPDNAVNWRPPGQLPDSYLDPDQKPEPLYDGVEFS